MFQCFDEYHQSLSERCSLLGTFASKVKNIDGRTLGKDDKVTVHEDVPTTGDVMNTPKDGFDIVHEKSKDRVEGTDVAIPLAAVDEFQRRRVLENGPWLIHLVPIILNTWTPDTILKKDEITAAPV
ncbi:hypothetical protein Tco_0429255 [Tanacetum coccineum]